MKPTDLLPEDIFIEDRGNGMFTATLGFLIYQGGVKIYQANGPTPQDAKQQLVSLMRDHLMRAIS